MNKDMWLDAAIRRGLIRVDLQYGHIYLTRRSFRKCKTRQNYRGYEIFTLKVDGVEKTCYVHRAVWIARHGVPKVGLTVNHIDGNKINNSIENLEMVSLEENKAHSVKNKMHAYGSHHGCAKLTEEQVRKILREYVPFKNGCVKLAEKYGVYRSTITKIVAGKTWKHVKI